MVNSVAGLPSPGRFAARPLPEGEGFTSKPARHLDPSQGPPPFNLDESPLYAGTRFEPFWTCRYRLPSFDSPSPRA